VTGTLAGKVALVSGAAGGIGTTIMDTLHGAGASVVGFDVESVIEATAPPGAKERGDWHWIPGDVGEDRSVAAAVAEVEEHHGRLDLVVHAAGITRDAVLWKLPEDHWDTVHRVNLKGAFLLMRHAVPLLRRTGGGRVVLIGSVNGSRGRFGQTAYASSKAGLLGLAKSAARETAKFDILVNVVEPGMTRTPMTAAMPDHEREAAVAEGLLGKMGDPEDVAEAVLFLCGPGAKHITGQTLRVDGGEYM
jgi:NAD(P)-dependent dehydrogenase (short-subunit alcohol dehydrogenase family)